MNVIGSAYYEPRPYPRSLRQLHYAGAVADPLSFNKADAGGHVSQPSLSEEIGELEHVLCVKLFERDRRQVLVTRQDEISSSGLELFFAPSMSSWKAHSAAATR